MAETQINDSASEPDPHPGTEPSPCHVTETWQQMLQGVLGGVLGIVLLLGALAMVHYYAPLAVQGAPPDDLQKQVHELTAQVEQLKQEQAMPAVVLNRYRNSERDFEPVGFTAHAPAVVVANKDFPAKDLRDFVAYLKKQGESVKQAHGGIGSSSHMACLLFASAAGVRPTLVAYRGTGPALNDLIGEPRAGGQPRTRADRACRDQRSAHA